MHAPGSLTTKAITGKACPAFQLQAREPLSRNSRIEQPCNGLQDEVSLNAGPIPLVIAPSS